MPLAGLIEAILFWKAEPVTVGDLAKWLGKSEGEIKEALELLEAKLFGRGVKLIQKDSEVMLGTAPEAGELIEKLTKEELNSELSKASLETLAVVLYQGPLTRAGIDYIRGVNSSFILRHLQVRVLVEKVINPADSRSFLYRPSFQLLTHLGVSKIEELPDYEEVKSELVALTGVLGQDSSLIPNL